MEKAGREAENGAIQGLVMPIYEFRCAECGHQFSLLRPMSQSGAEGTCPRCNAPGARRLISTFAAVGVATGEADCGPVG
jgi:putative FmdB family regulatory protein